jgi:hypothetical protein
MLDSSELLILAQLLNNILKKQKVWKIKITNSRNNTLLSSSASAQVSVNLNIGTESSWHPYESWENNGYSNIEYYYLPTLSVIMM